LRKAGGSKKDRKNYNKTIDWFLKFFAEWIHTIYNNEQSKSEQQVRKVQSWEKKTCSRSGGGESKPAASRLRAEAPWNYIHGRYRGRASERFCSPPPSLAQVFFFRCIGIIQVSSLCFFY
jgi:hypothetical protein